MARKAIIGLETGDLLELHTPGANAVIESTVVRSGAYSVKFSSASTARARFVNGINLSRVYAKAAIALSSLATYAGAINLAWELFLFEDSSGTDQCTVNLIHDRGTGATTIEVKNSSNALVGSATSVTLAGANTFDVFEADFTKGAGTGSISLYQNGSLIFSASSQQFGSNNTDRVSGGQDNNAAAAARSIYFDDIEIDDAALCGMSRVVARQPTTGGSPTYNAWTKSSGTDAGALLDNTPFDTTDKITSAVSAAGQTAVIASFATTQSGHGSHVIGAGDTIKGAVVRAVAKTASTAYTAGDLKGTLTGFNASFGSGINATGSVVVEVGDLVFVAVAEETSINSTGVTDNLGNTYSAASAGTDQVGCTLRCFYSRVTVAGTLTTVSVAASGGGTHNVNIPVAVFQGPFTVSPLDANPADTTDSTPTYNGPATGTLAQAIELVVGVCALSRTTLTQSGTYSTALLEGGGGAPCAMISYTKSASTASVAGGAWTGSTDDAVQATKSFKIDTANANSGDNLSLRRRVAGADTDTAINLTTSDALYSSDIFTAAVGDLNSAEIGVKHGLNTITQTVEDMWLMVSYVPSSGVTIAVTTGAYSMAGKPTGLNRGLKMPVTAGAYAVAGTGPGKKQGYAVQVTRGLYTWGGQATGLLFKHILPVTTGAYAWAGQAIAIVRGKGVQVAAGAYAMTGVGPAFSRVYRAAIAAAAYVMAGTGPAERWTRQMPVTTGLYVWSGKATGMLRQYLVQVTRGLYTMTGTGPGKKQGYVAQVTRGIYTWGGQATGLLFKHVMPVVTGTYAWSGKTTGLLRGYTVQVTRGLYAMTGTGPGERWTRRMPVTVGAYVWGGVATALKIAHVMPVVTGLYTWAGKATGLLRGYKVQVTRGLYSMSGTGPTFAPWHRRLTVPAGVYAMTGQIVRFGGSLRLVVTTGAYAWSGVSTALFTSVRRFVTWGRQIALTRERDD